jgi:hypothetical protein
LSAAALIIFTVLLFPYAVQAREKALNILYTGALKGELEPCGCSPETQSGGLARLSGYISANQKTLSPYVLVDAGNAFAEATDQGRLKNEAIIRSFALMGYDAAALSSNKTIKAVKSGLKINISSDEKLVKKGMINILLSGKPVAELKAIKGWDIMISSSGEELDEPVASGKAVIVSGFPKGQKLGILSLKLNSKGNVIGSSHRWQALKQDVAEDPMVRAVLKEYDQKVAALLKEEELKPVSHVQYLGSESCVECHQPYVESWKTTKHSAAFATLERVGKSKDPECVRCHTVGFDEEGGFLSLKATPGLANVQCESCHGPGREHAAGFSPMRPIGIEVCLRCHTHENSPEFDFQKYLEKIKH